jgi:hypothetical protein
MDGMAKLCAWYERQCVDEWHEDHGVNISTLDNPGWSLKVDLGRTNLEGREFSEIKRETSEHDWLVARKRGHVFEAAGGPMNLPELVDVFLSWADGR